MALYKVTVATGKFLQARTRDYISITLVGALGEGQKRALDHFGIDFLPGAVDEYHIKEERDLGEILLIRLHKDPFSIFPEDNWYCMYVTVTSPGGANYRFPCYRWIEGYLTLELAEATAMLSSASNLNVALQKQRESDLEQRRKVYRWKVYLSSFPKCLDVANNDELDKDAKYSITKTVNFAINQNISDIAIKLKGFDGIQESWKSFDEMKRVYWTLKTETSEYVYHHWKEDAFFGYQYLNGVDPTLIKRCNTIPGNFPVTNEMVSYSLGASTSLEKELQKGTIFIVDHKMMEGLRASVLNGKQQYITAPLCLFYRTPKDEIIPLAIQLNQTPGSETPIFLPNDNEWDWILSKIWVRSATFSFHQAVAHLLRTHLFAEVCSIATLRHLPTAHPLYKLLVPHLRYTLQINVIARERLIGPGGVFDKNTAVGTTQLIKRDMETLTYATLCLPENLQSREVQSLPHFYYRDDGLKIWLAIESYVSGIVDCYYKSEESVQKDPELQAWVATIFKEGFLERESSGIPSSLETRVELIKYLTVVIFTCSAQHAAVNSGQFDFLSWMPNAPSTMRQPPPKTKGLATMESVLEALPEVGITTNIMTAVWTLSKEPGDMRPLGSYPDEHFTEEGPKRCIRAFQQRLSEISVEIEHRNASLPIKYNYLNPKVIENSVSI